MSSVIVNPNKANNNPRIDFSGNAITAFMDISGTTGNIFGLGTQTGNIRLVTAGIDRLHISNTGNVGIGNSNPQYPLDVNGQINTPTMYFPIYGSNTLPFYGIEIGPYQDNALISTGGGAFYFYTNQITKGNPAGSANKVCTLSFTNGFGTNDLPINSGSGNISTTGTLSINRKVSGFQKKIWNCYDLGLQSVLSSLTANQSAYILIASDLSLTDETNFGFLTIDGFVGSVNGGTPATISFNLQINTRYILYVGGTTNTITGGQNPLSWFDFVVTITSTLTYNIYLKITNYSNFKNKIIFEFETGGNDYNGSPLLKEPTPSYIISFPSGETTTNGIASVFNTVQSSTSNKYNFSGGANFTGTLAINRKVSGFQKKIWNSSDLGLNVSGSTINYYYLLASFTDTTQYQGSNFGQVTVKGFIGTTPYTNVPLPPIANFDFQLSTRGRLILNGTVSTTSTYNTSSTLLSFIDFVVTQDPSGRNLLYLNIKNQPSIFEFEVGGYTMFSSYSPQLYEPTSSTTTLSATFGLTETIVIPSVMTSLTSINPIPNNYYFSGGINMPFNGVYQNLGNVILNTTTQTIQIEPINMPYTKATKSLTYNTGVAIYSNNIKADVTTSSITAPTTVTFGPKKPFMMVAGGKGGNTLAYSNDGINWYGSANGTTIFTTSVTSIIYDGVKWIAGGNGGNTLGYSYDGTTWNGSPATNGLFTSYGLFVGYNGQRYVAGGDAPGNTLAYSNDGINWYGSANGTTIFSNSARCVVWIGQRWVAGGKGGNTLAYSYDGITWTGLGNSIFTNTCWGIAWNGKRGVATGEGGNTFAYSNDGISWTGAGASIITSVGRAVAWNGQRWVAGGNGGNTLAYSNDGITWTGAGSSIFGYCYSLSWNYQMFIAGGETGNTLAYSYDGITWTGAGSSVFTTYCTTIADNTALANSVTINKNLCLACGYGGNSLAYSADGMNWTASVNGTSVHTTSCNSIIWTGQKWLACGKGGNTLAYSYDGTNWTGLGTSIFSSEGRVIARDINGTFFVAGGYGTNTLAYSYDGINWTGLGNSIFTDTANGCYAVAYNGKLWVAVGVGTNYLAYSYDGITWTGLGNSIFTGYGRSVSWNGKIWLAGGQTTNQMAYSYDGINWIANTSGNACFSTGCWGFGWNGQKWMAGGAGTGNTLAYSYDGLTWTGLGKTTFTSECRSVHYNGERWVASGNGGNTLAYSTDGNTWAGLGIVTFSTSCVMVTSTQQMAPSGNPIPTVNVNMQPMYVAGAESGQNMGYSYDGYRWISLGASIFSTVCRSVLWTGKMWLASGKGTNTLGYSYDGINWTGLGSSIFSLDSRGMATNGNIIIATGAANNSTNTLAYSYDGINWTGLGKITFTSDCNSVVWTGNKFYCCGSGGNTIASSSDGINWTGVTSPFSTNCYALGFNGRMLVAAGVGGNVTAYSYDGISWTGKNSGQQYVYATNMNSNSICWNGSIWVMGCGSGGNTIASSYDGINWTGRNSLGSSTDIRSIIWDGKNFIGCGVNIGFTFSSDGINWSTRNVSGFNNNGMNSLECSYPRVNGPSQINQKLYLTNNNYGSSTTLQFSTDSYYQPGYNDINISVTSNAI